MGPEAFSCAGWVVAFVAVGIVIGLSIGNDLTNRAIENTDRALEILRRRHPPPEDE